MKQPSKEKIARLVREARIAKGYTQQELSDKAQISLRSVQRIEKCGSGAEDVHAENTGGTARVFPVGRRSAGGRIAGRTSFFTCPATAQQGAKNHPDNRYRRIVYIIGRRFPGAVAPVPGNHV